MSWTWRVDVTAADQCMFGLKTWGTDGKSWESAQMRRTTSSSATIGVARRTCGSVPGGLVQGDLHGFDEGAAQQGVPRRKCLLKENSSTMWRKLLRILPTPLVGGS